MKELNFDTGLITYTVNGKCQISFNPADPAFVERLFKAFDGLAKRQEHAETEKSAATGEELFALAEQRDKEMRSAIDNIFGDSICDMVFGDLSVYAMASGLPLWCNFLMAIIDEVDASVTEQQKQANPRIERYMAKYAKYNRK